MKKTAILTSSLALAVAFNLAGCTPNNTGLQSQTSPDPVQLTGVLSGGGASSQEAAQIVWAENFKSKQPNIQIQYNAVGSGSGVKGLINGQYSYAGSDSALKNKDYQLSKQACGPQGAFAVPVYLIPVAVVVNLTGIDGGLRLDPDTLAKIMSGQITQWNDPAIANQNPDAQLPDEKIVVVHRSDESGTTENFTEYLAQAAPKSWPYEASKKWPIAGQEAAQKTQGVVSLVAITPNSISYAEAAAVGKLATVSIKVGQKYVAPTAGAAAKTVELSKQRGGGAKADLAMEVDHLTVADGAYPIVMVSYQIFCSTYQDKNQAEMVKAYAKYLVSAQAQQKAAEEIGSAPLPEKLAQKAAKSVDTIGFVR